MTGFPECVLVVTAMFPSPEHPARGVVVEREVAAIRAAGLDVRVATKSPGILGYANQWRRAQELQRALRPTVVHAHFGTSGLVAACLRKRHRLVLTLHGSDVTYGPGFTASKHWLQYWMSVVAARRADVVIVQAAFMRKRLPRSLWDRVVLLPQAVTEAFPAPVQPRDPNLILFLGDARRPVKRAALAQAALQELSQPDLRLVSLDRLAVAAIPTAMATARVGVLTSVKEGLPVACREALASGLPLVAVDLPGTRELAALVPEGVLLVSADPHSVADGLRRLAAVTEGDLGRELSDRLRARSRDLGWGLREHTAQLLVHYRGGHLER